jgi:hypothetical protein
LQEIANNVHSWELKSHSCLNKAEVMATARDVKKLLEPLLARHRDLEIVGRELIVKPVRHVLRAVLIDRTSSADTISPRWYVHHLFPASLKFEPRLMRDAGLT